MTEQDTTIEEAFEKIESAADHKQRAEALVEEAKGDIKTAVESAVTFEATVDVSYDPDAELFTAEVMPVDVSAPPAGESYGVASVSPLMFTFGDLEGRDRARSLRELIEEIEDQHPEGAPVSQVVKRARVYGMSEEEVETEMERLREVGEVYEPSTNYFRTT